MLDRVHRRLRHCGAEALDPTGLEPERLYRVEDALHRLAFVAGLARQREAKVNTGDAPVPHPGCEGAAERHERDVVLLLPVGPREPPQLGQQPVDQVARGRIGDVLDETGRAEHLALGPVGLGDAVAVEQQAVSGAHHRLVLLVGHAGKEPERHALRSQLHRPVGGACVRQVVTRVRIAHVTRGRVEHEVEARDEHLLRDIRAEEIVDALEHLAGRDHPLAGGTQQASCSRHHHGGRHALVRDVADEDGDMPVWQLEEVVEIAAHLAGGLVVRRHLPAGKVRQDPREEVLLDQLGDLELLLDPLARPRLCGLLLDELGDLEGGGGLGREAVEEALVVRRVLLVGEARAEVESADELAAADQRHDERDAGLAE